MMTVTSLIPTNEMFWSAFPIVFFLPRHVRIVVYWRRQFVSVGTSEVTEDSGNPGEQSVERNGCDKEFG